MAKDGKLVRHVINPKSKPRLAVGQGKGRVEPTLGTNRRPMFQTRQHQALSQALGKMFKEHKIQSDTPQGLGFKQTVWALAQLFQRDNPNFDWASFKEKVFGRAG